MSTLPDINTSEVSYIAYWNAIDQGGVDSIAPDEALSAGSLQEYVLYDNGWEGTYTLGNGRNAKVRVKNDGWIIAYIDRSANYGTNIVDRQMVTGPWDCLANWTSANLDNGPNSLQPSITNSALHRAIDDIRTQMSNSGEMTFTTGDVGLYNYVNESATTLTLLGASTTGNEQPTFLYTSDTTRHSHTTIGTVWAGDDHNGYVNFEGLELVNFSGDDKIGHGVIDTLNEGLAPQPSTEYQAEIDGRTDDFSHQYVYATVGQFVAWE